MTENGVAWVESLIQILWAVPFCYSAHRIVGFKRRETGAPAWALCMLAYFAWRVSSELLTLASGAGRLDPGAAAVAKNVISFATVYIVVPLVLQGSLLKRYLYYLITEMLGSVAYYIRSLGILFLEKNGWYDALKERTYLLLLVRIVLEFAPFFLLLYLLKKPLAYYRAHEIRQRKAGWALVALLVGLELAGTLSALNFDVLFSLRILTGAVGGCALGAVFLYYQKRENDALYFRQKLMENYYRTMERETRRMDAVRAQFSALMERAGKLQNPSCAAGAGDSAEGTKLSPLETEEFACREGKFAREAQEYAEGLKKIHRQLQRTEYCGNVLFDALFHNKDQRCREHGVAFSVDITGAVIADHAKAELFSVLGDLLDMAIDVAVSHGDAAGRSVSFTARTAAGMQMFEILCRDAAAGEPTAERPAPAKEQKQRLRSVRRGARRLGGWCTVEWPKCPAENYDIRVVLALPTGQ